MRIIEALQARRWQGIPEAEKAKFAFPGLRPWTPQNPAKDIAAKPSLGSPAGMAQQKAEVNGELPSTTQAVEKAAAKGAKKPAAPPTPAEGPRGDPAPAAAARGVPSSTTEEADSSIDPSFVKAVDAALADIDVPKAVSASVEKDVQFCNIEASADGDGFGLAAEEPDFEQYPSEDDRFDVKQEKIEKLMQKMSAM